MASLFSKVLFIFIVRIKPTGAYEDKWIYYQDRHEKYNTYTEWQYSKLFYMISFRCDTI